MLHRTRFEGPLKTGCLIQASYPRRRRRQSAHIWVLIQPAGAIALESRRLVGCKLKSG